jgi:selenocysteine lyase/cysteine desulfurase
LLDCGQDEVAFIHNTTHGLLCVAQSLTWRPGDNIVIAEHEFPANVYPWKSLRERGVAVRVAPERGGRFEIDDFAALIDGRTRLLAVSMVQYGTGFRMPTEKLGQLCAERGVLLCVDGIQGLGALPVDVKEMGCHFLAADGHKWLLSAEGFGVLYVRREVLPMLNGSMTGWIGRPRPGDYDDLDQPLVESAKRFEEGSHAMALAAAFEKSTELLLEVGQPRVWELIRNVTGRLDEELKRMGLRVVSSMREEERSGIVAFDPGGVEARSWVEALKARKIHVAGRRGWIRVSPHFYNTTDQIDQLIAALRELRDRGS